MAVATSNRSPAHPRLVLPLGGRPAIEGSWMSKPTKLEWSNAAAMIIEDAPSPQPTSATLAPERQLLDYPVQGGQPLVDEVGGVAGTEERHDPGEEPSCAGQPMPSPVRNAATTSSWSA